jgi:hypothetical protein
MDPEHVESALQYLLAHGLLTEQAAAIHAEPPVVVNTPQPKVGPNPIQVAYTTGLFDGEGCVCLSGAGTKAKLTVTIANTCYEALEQVRAWFGGTIRNKNNVDAKHKRCFTWTLNGYHAASFLQQVEPYALIKKGQVKAGLSFLRLKQRLVRSSTPQELALLDQHVDLVHWLNRRGPGFTFAPPSQPPSA